MISGILNKIDVALVLYNYRFVEENCWVRNYLSRWWPFKRVVFAIHYPKVNRNLRVCPCETYCFNGFIHRKVLINCVVL